MRQGIIFDFDDTLVYTNSVFEAVKEKFYKRMAELSLFDENLPKILNYYDIENVKAFGGLTKECFPLALRKTYKEYCLLKKAAYDEKEANRLEVLGWQVFKEPVNPVPGCLELLKDLKKEYKLFLITQGDKLLQKSRLEKSGLLGFFEDYGIFKAKSSYAFISLIKNHGLEAKNSWSVGNSLRSDIKPALRAGFKAIHIKNDSWDYEYSNRQGFYHQAADLINCRQYLLKKYNG